MSKVYTHDVFMDSGAWGLFSRHVLKTTGKQEVRMGRHGRPLAPLPQGPPSLKFFSMKAGSDFRKYLDSYASFMKKMLAAGKMKLFANVDVIGSPEKTWETQSYFEQQHGLRPMPVIHKNAPMLWIGKYLERGYRYIGFGGFASGVGGWAEMRKWCDQAFILLCPRTNDYKPIVKVHGFAMTGLRGIWRWPWASVDSTSWVIWPANGWIPVPKWTERDGWKYDTMPLVINVCPTSSTKKLRHRHMENVPPAGKELLKKWLADINVPMGKADAEGKLIEWGVVSHHQARTIANLHYFKGLERSIPKWPWPLRAEIIRRRTMQIGFGL